MTIPRFLAAAALGAALLAPAFAQTEPTIDQIYQAANTGRLAEADRMIGQVLQKHPGSAKAHYVKAELAARESDAATARQELATAERLAPGLPFAKAEAVSALRSEVNRAGRVDRAPAALAPAPAPAQRQQVPMALVAVLFALAAGAFYLVMRRRQAAADAGAMAQPWNGGHGPGPEPVAYPPAGYPPGAYPPGAYPPAAYPPGAYPQPVQPGMGSTLGRGLATGLAVGAGVVAAEEIGRRMFEHHPQSAPAPASSGVLPENERGLLDPGVNGDMGGQDFGINDPGSWDDGGSADPVGGDWDT